MKRISILAAILLASTLPIVGQEPATDSPTPPPVQLTQAATLNRLDFSVYILALFTIIYIIQVILVVAQASSNNGKPEEKSILKAVVLSPDGFSATWVFGLVTMVLPACLSLFPKLATIFGSVVNTEPLSVAAAVYYTCLSFLYVLVTIEISYLYNFRNSSSPSWRNMLFAALVLDLLALTFFTSFIGEPTANEKYTSTTVGFLASTGIMSVISSAFIIVCAREDNRRVEVSE